MLVLWGAVTLVLLIACANIANMLLARTADRERELGIRLAIGGSRGRVIRQLVTENLLVGILGSSVGLVIARLLLGTLIPASADRLPRVTPMTLDWRVLVFAVVLSLLTTLLVSLPLAVRVGRIDFGGALRSAPRGATETRDRFRSVLVVAQVALGLVLLSGAATMTAGLRHFTHRDLGFRPDHLLTFSVAASDANVPTLRQIQFTNDLLHALRAVPGVTSVSGSMALPLAGEHLYLAFDMPERPRPPSERPNSTFAIVTPEFFDTIGASFEEGRRFTDQDDARHPRVVIVNRAFADRFFPGRRVLGRYIEPGATSDLDPPDGSARLKEIVGVVGNVRQAPLGHDAEPMYYLPYAQLAWMTPPMIVRTTGRPEAAETDIRRVVAHLDRGAPVHDVRTMDGVLADGVAGPRFQMLLLCGFAGIGLVLVATGVYRRAHVCGASAHTRDWRSCRARCEPVGDRRNDRRMGGAIGDGGCDAGGRRRGRRPRTPRRTLVDAGLSFGLPLAAVTAVVVLTSAAAACLPALRAASVAPTDSLRSE